MSLTTLTILGSKLVQLSLPKYKGKDFHTIQTPSDSTPCSCPGSTHFPLGYGALIVREDLSTVSHIGKALTVSALNSSLDWRKGSSSKVPGADKGNSTKSLASLCNFLSFKDPPQDWPDQPSEPHTLQSSLDSCLWNGAPRTTDPRASLQHHLSPKSKESSLVWEARVKPSAPRCLPKTLCLWHIIPLSLSSAPQHMPLSSFPIGFEGPLKPPKQPKTNSLFLKNRGHLIFHSLLCSKERMKTFLH